MKIFQGNIEDLTRGNNNYRKVLYTTKNSQLVLMSLKPGEQVGEEVHKVDQFFCIEQGTAVFVINDDVFIERDGDCVIVPAGTKHNVMNTSRTASLKFYTIYSPPNHPDKEIVKNRSDKDD